MFYVPSNLGLKIRVTTILVLVKKIARDRPRFRRIYSRLLLYSKLHEKINSEILIHNPENGIKKTCTYPCNTTRWKQCCRSGSGFVSQRSGSRSFYHQAKIVRKTLIPTVLSLLYDLKNDVNVPSKSQWWGSVTFWCRSGAGSGFAPLTNGSG